MKFQRRQRWIVQTGRALCLGAALIFLVIVPALAADRSPDPEDQGLTAGAQQAVVGWLHELKWAAIRLPLATVLGAALALRPRRPGTPPRIAAVVQTQIVLAIVGAVIMLVVGASLARAFGIVGVASLIRYRSKINDPKDAVVMLSALAVGLAAGVGTYSLAVFATLFLVVTLGVIENFEPQTRRYELSLKLGAGTADYRPRIESILDRHKADYELRASSDEEVSYLVTMPYTVQVDRISRTLEKLPKEGTGAVEWKPTPKDKVK